MAMILNLLEEKPIVRWEITRRVVLTGRGTLVGFDQRRRHLIHTVGLIAIRHGNKHHQLRSPFYCVSRCICQEDALK